MREALVLGGGPGRAILLVFGSKARIVLQASLLLRYPLSEQEQRGQPPTPATCPPRPAGPGIHPWLQGLDPT